jgi:uncharacterized surface protein with fasciclin (FAS1) repeats/formylglycine-generating enzyme required for sulfatase activity
MVDIRLRSSLRRVSGLAMLCASLAPVAALHAHAAAQQFVQSQRVTLARPVSTSDIVDTAIAAKFTTLARALEAAGLVDALKGAGPFTVFAPTDEAFAALPKGTLESLLLPENKERLRDILTHHVVPGRLLSHGVGNIDVPQMARTAAGDREPICADAAGFRFGDALVVRPDIGCSNGVIHVIDRVVLPKEQRSEQKMKMEMKEAAPADLLAALRAVPDGRFSTFVAAVEASGADQDWAQREPERSWTLFIPTNDAFARLSDAERSAILDPKNREMLRAVLDWHALPKLQAWGFDFNDGERGPAMISENNDRFVLDVISNGTVFVYRMRSGRVPRSAEEPFKARIVAGDIAVGGTVVHVVDRVIVPPQFENTLIASQAYREKDVEESAMAGFVQFRTLYTLRETMRQAESLDDEAAVALYRFGLRLLEEVVVVSRTGVLMSRDMNSDRRDVLRDRLRARIDDLDRVWYAMFMKNSPAATTLSAPLPATVSAARVDAPPVARAPVAPAVTVSAATATLAPAASTVATAAASTPPRAPSTPDWCEVVERDVDAKVVTDAAMRDAIARTGLPWRVRDKASGIELLLVPPGQFRMGKSAGDAEAIANEVPAHSVTLTEPYYLGRYEVTREQWIKVMSANSARAEPRMKAGVQGADVQTPDGSVITISGGVQLVDQQGNAVQSCLEAQAGPGGVITFTTTAIGDEPASAPDSRSGLPITVGWRTAVDFSSQLGMRLPTEAEWEFACRAGVDAPRYGELDAIAWHRGNSGGRKHPVGTKAANALGFHDMIGNAWEWVNDRYGDYTRSAKTNPTGPESGTSRIARGSYFNYEDGFCRSSRRYEIQSPELGGATGFRVARNP